jgi:hypothetical protein
MLPALPTFAPRIEGEAMKEVTLDLPELAMVVGTRAMAGAGIAMLLADKMTPEQRRAVGWTLFLIGAISTVPLAMRVFGKLRLVA